MNLYDAMFARVSCRKFRMTPLEAERLSHIEKYLALANALDDSIGCRMVIRRQLDEKKKPSGKFLANAPYFLLFYSEKKEGYLENAGYILEQVVLYMTMHGIGTCYQGSMKFSDKILEEKGMVPVIAIAFGLPESENKRNEGDSHVRRKRLTDIAVIKEEPSESIWRVLRAVRVAPSALNLQPWRLIVYHNRVHIFLKKSLLPVGKIQRLDIGILLMHMVYAAEEQWMETSVERLETILEQDTKGYEYMFTVNLKPVE